MFPVEGIARIMKKVLPTDACIDRQALLDAQLCLAQLVACLTTEAGMANIQQNRNKDRMLGGEDIVMVLEAMGMEQHATLVRSYLSKYRELTKPKL